MWELDYKETQCWRIDAFALWCWRRLLRVPWTARRSNQSILKKSVLNVHWKDWCWSWNPNTSATWWEELTHLKRTWCWERLKLEKGMTEDEMVGWHHQLTWVWVNSRSWWWTGRPGVLQSMESQRVGHDWATELNWTEPQSSSINFSPEGIIRKSNNVVFEVLDLPSRLFNLYNLGSDLVGWSWRDHLIS